MQLLPTGVRSPASAISWNADNATQLATASDDDNHPAIYLWDLKNARAPEKSLLGHAKGILSLSWCPGDPDLLLARGGTEIHPLESQNWQADRRAAASSELDLRVRVVPKKTRCILLCQLRGTVQFFSVQSIVVSRTQYDFIPSQGQQLKHTDPMSSAQGTVQAADSFNQVPKWLKCHFGACVGFADRLVAFSGRRVKLYNGVLRPVFTHILEDSVDSLSERAFKLETAISGHMLSDYCASQISISKKSESKLLWASLYSLFDEFDGKNKLVSVLLSEEKSPEDDIPTDYLQNDFSNQESVDFEDMINVRRSSEPQSSNLGPLRRQSTFESVPFSLIPENASSLDREITKSIVTGNYQKAVDLCMSDSRLSDALLIAICGGDQMVRDTRRKYLQNASSAHPYLRLVSSIVKNDLSDVVYHADLKDWKSLITMLLSSQGVEAPATFSILASRFENEAVDASDKSLTTFICNMLSGNLKKSCDVLKQSVSAIDLTDTGAIAYQYLFQSIFEFVEKLRVIEALVHKQGGEWSLRDDFAEYYAFIAYVLKCLGMDDLANAYLPNYNNSKENPILGRLYGEQAPIAPFISTGSGLLKQDVAYKTLSKPPVEEAPPIQKAIRLLQNTQLEEREQQQVPPPPPPRSAPYIKPLPVMTHIAPPVAAEIPLQLNQQMFPKSPTPPSIPKVVPPTNYNDPPVIKSKVEGSASQLSNSDIQHYFKALLDTSMMNATPMQKKIIDDSKKRMESLFDQIASSKVSSDVSAKLSQMIGFMQKGQWDKALSLHAPLMSGHFAEVGTWILALKRLIELARQQS